MWVENLASLELHVPLARAASPENPDMIVFDLDPGDKADIIDCAEVALILRDLLLDMKLTSFVKTSGMKGLHVYVPLNSRKTTFDDTKKFSKSVAEVMQRNYPDLVTAKMAKDLRTKKVFINWSQNDSAKTTVCVYSLRAAEKPVVSFPLAWKDMEKLKAQGDADKFQVPPSGAISRLAKNGDLFREMTENKTATSLSVIWDWKNYKAKRKFASTPEPQTGQRHGSRPPCFCYPEACRTGTSL